MDSAFWAIAFSRIELLPVAILVAFLANSSGFSGGILFQPFIYFTQGLSLPVSIATGIASETIGMVSGATRYHWMRKIEWSEIKPGLLFVFFGVVAGYSIFQLVSQPVLKLVLALFLISISLLKFWELFTKAQSRSKNTSSAWTAGVGFFGGVGSACTGTGACELHQPYFERLRGLTIISANAAAIATEAWANLWISAFNLSWGLIDFSVLIWTGPGVLIGSQFGALASRILPPRLMKFVFSMGVLAIGSFYLFQVRGLWLS